MTLRFTTFFEYELWTTSRLDCPAAESKVNPILDHKAHRLIATIYTDEHWRFRVVQGFQIVSSYAFAGPTTVRDRTWWSSFRQCDEMADRNREILNRGVTVKLLPFWFRSYALMVVFVFNCGRSLWFLLIKSSKVIFHSGNIIYGMLIRLRFSILDFDDSMNSRVDFQKHIQIFGG